MFNIGNTGFMLLATSLVMLMTPGLAFFYGGLVGRKNVLGIMIQSFVSMGVTTLLWFMVGYSLCFSGDIHGIISQLDYIKSLGFETIWFSPFFKSPQMDHGYDVSDYQDIQPEYGDLKLVDSLITEVHSRDMKIVFDLVLNHTSIQHSWFQESKSSKDNPKSDWYVWRNGKNGGPPNNWKNILGQVPAWNYVPERDQFYYAAFLPFQPDLNMANPEVKAEIFKMVKFWLDKDVDGFRLDIFNFIFEDESYADNPTTWRYLPKIDEGKWVFEEHKYNSDPQLNPQQTTNDHYKTE